ncbi:hypothetical protein ACX27_09785 [Nostoc piscinale CENA21]|uniref:Uncharacterized protein n=1 Tax=Nostoc piscinale CENA21 TaxID=224013 RepID=A0A0M4SWH8_9NOSO|nr:hypothetical protein ACX27_09785 [Nostoc piscinale CENA21]
MIWEQKRKERQGRDVYQLFRIAILILTIIYFSYLSKDRKNLFSFDIYGKIYSEIASYSVAVSFLQKHQL